MPPTKLLKQWMWIGVGFVWLISLVVHPANALTAHQICRQTNLCTIGEFVYSDAAAPLTNATCQLTSFNPSGQTFISAAPLIGTADGWYAYSFTPTINTPVGTYPTQLCCQTSENNICIDKTFEITPAPTPGLTAQDVSTAVWNATISGNTPPGSFGSKVNDLQNNTLSASDIWNYSGRTLTSFGSLVSDIWGSANRTLTSFGSLVSDVTTSIWSSPNRSLTDTQNIADNVWNAPAANYSTPGSFGNKVNDLQNNTLSPQQIWEYQNRSLTSFGNLVSSIWSADNRTATDPNGATAASITQLQQQIQAAQTMIQQLSANSLSTTNSLTSTDYAAALETKLQHTKDYLSQLTNNMEIITTRLGLLSLKWDQLSDTDRTQELHQLLTLMGSPDSTNMDSVIGQLHWFVLNWPKNSTSTLYQNVVNLRTDINDFITAIQASPNSDAQLTTINQLFATSQSLQTDIGDISQSPTSPSLYGQYKTNRALAENLASQLRILTNTLTEWDHLSLADRDALINSLAKDVGVLNRFSTLKPLLAPITSTPAYLLQLRSVITANQAALAASTDPVVVNWMGPDATSYYTFVYNPSKTTPQTAQISYFLPSELTTEHLTNTPSSFTTTFDPNHNAIAVTGSLNLDPDSSTLQLLTTANIWEINPATLETLRTQINALTTSLDKSPFYPQAVAIQQHSLQALDAIQQLQANTRTPDAKIQAYRQIQTLQQSVEQGLNQLQALANSSQTTHSLMGFVGGVQAVAVWGMIVIVIAGFIFLSLYMRALYQQLGLNPTPAPEPETLTLPLAGPRLLPATTAPTTSTTALPPIHLPFSFNLDSLTQKRFAFSFVFLSALLLTVISLRSPTPRPATPALAPLEPLASPPATPSSSPSLSPSPSPSPTASPSAAPEEATATPSAQLLISPPDLDSYVNVRRLPTTQSPIITTIAAEETAISATSSGDWLQVTLIDRDPPITGWLNRHFAIIINN